MNTNVQPVIQRAYARHQIRQQGLDLCKVLLELIQNLQQHRGATLAVLGGDHFFETRIQALEPHILKALRTLDRQSTQFLDPLDWRRLYSEWFTVHRQWRQDSAIHNFELHTHLIQEVQKQLWAVATRSGHADQDLNQQQAARLTLQDLPQLMEHVAQFRGLATHAAAGGVCDPEFRVRLEYLNREISRQFQSLEQAMIHQETLDTRLGRQHPLLFDSLERWGKLHRRIEVEILAVEVVQTSPDALFAEVSLLISNLYGLTLTGVRQLRTSLDTDIQQWIVSSRYD